MTKKELKDKINSIPMHKLLAAARAIESSGDWNDFQKNRAVTVWNQVGGEVVSVEIRFLSHALKADMLDCFHAILDQIATNDGNLDAVHSIDPDYTPEWWQAPAADDVPAPVPVPSPAAVVEPVLSEIVAETTRYSEDGTKYGFFRAGTNPRTSSPVAVFTFQTWGKAVQFYVENYGGGAVFNMETGKHIANTGGRRKNPVVAPLAAAVSGCGYVEKRTLSCCSLRGLCIREDWYTCGTCEEYGKLFDRLYEADGFTLRNLTTADIAEIAEDIADHSRLPDGYDVPAIMYEVAQCCSVAFDRI